MPIRKGNSKLWFKTQEQIDEYDDRNLAAIELTSRDEDDQNYSIVFLRAKKEFYLKPNSKVLQDAQKINKIFTNPIQFIDKYCAGKRDHTYDREWTFHRFGLGYLVSYLLLRQLPIRNFYARCWVMLIFLSKVAETSGNPFKLRQQLMGMEDEWTNKQIKNYDVYSNYKCTVIPNHYNKISEHYMWKMNQPAYYRPQAQKYAHLSTSLFFGPRNKTVAWDGTFNMPLQSLLHRLHKDAKFTDMIIN